MTMQNERRVLNEAELDRVFGGTTADDFAQLRMALAVYNTLMGIAMDLVKIQADRNQQIVRNMTG